MPELRSLTGRDKAVSDYVLSSEGAADFLDAYEKAIAIAIEGYAQEDKHYVTIAIGCTGGQHRSVAMSEPWPNACAREGYRFLFPHVSLISGKRKNDRIMKK